MDIISRIFMCLECYKFYQNLEVQAFFKSSLFSFFLVISNLIYSGK